MHPKVVTALKKDLYSLPGDTDIDKYSGREHPLPQVGGRNKLLPCLFKNKEQISFDPKIW